jgi:hypothetical protein
MRARAILACVALAAFAATVPGTSAVAAGNGGFRTKQASMLTGVLPGVGITPILTVGDVLPGGFRFEAIPDGISVRPRGGGRTDIYVNHETSKVPFPYNPLQWTTDPGESQNDFDNAQVSRLAFNAGGRVLDGTFAIPSSQGYQRFCSNYLATGAEGFGRPILFTNEESPDYAFRQENSWPPPPIGDPNEKEAGVVVALDVQSGNYHPIFGMGRHNHENDVAIPGFDDLVVMSGDDTFTSGPLTLPPGPNPAASVPAQSQLYSYIASDTDSLLNDGGGLYAFVSDTAGVTDYYDFTPGSGQSITGHFIKVPEDIAMGRNPDGSEMKAADVPVADGGPFPAPPTNGSWQTDLRNPSIGIDGPQWVLEYWSDLNNVFQFVRVEDIAYDKRPGKGNIVYLADTGRGSAGQGAGISTNGRIWKMVLDPDDPKTVTSMSLFLDGDDSPVQTLGEIHQPDNLESIQTGLLVTEDPGSRNQFAPTSTDPNATTARLWYVPFSGSPQVVAKVNQSADEGSTDVDPVDNPPFVGGSFPISPGNLGGWESSGIVDASAAFGPGAFLINVQAHTLWVDSAPGYDTFVDGADTNPDFTFKREGGQLLLLRIPGI